MYKRINLLKHKRTDLQMKRFMNIPLQLVDSSLSAKVKLVKTIDYQLTVVMFSSITLGIALNAIIIMISFIQDKTQRSSY